MLHLSTLGLSKVSLAVLGAGEGKKKRRKRKEDRRSILWRKVSEKEKEVQKGIRNTHFIPFCPG